MAKSRNGLRDCNPACVGSHAERSFRDSVVSTAHHAQCSLPLRIADQMPAPMFLAVKVLHRRGWPHSLATVRRGHDKARRWQQRPKLPTRTAKGPWKLWRGLQIPCTGCRRATAQNISRCRACIQVATLWGSHVTQAECHTYADTVDAAFRAIRCLERVARTPQGIQHEFLSRMTQLIARSTQCMRHTDDKE